MSQKHLKIILSAQYFIFFGVMGIVLPYFNLYCYHLNLSGLEIGIIGSTRSLLMIVCSLGWGIIADRYQNRRFLYIVCQFVYAVVSILFLYAHTFVEILCVTILASIFYSPLISFMEAFTMDLIGHNKHAYGPIRLWGSIQFIVMVLCVGALLNHFSYHIIIHMIVIGGFLQALVALAIPKTTQKVEVKRQSDFGVFKQSHVLIYLLGLFLMLFSHGTYYAFSSIHLEQMGASSNEIAIFWALGSISEIFVMLNSTRLFNRFRVESVLNFSFGVAALRWFLMFYSTSVIFSIMTQILHAVTYGAFHVAGILYMDRCMPNASKTTGQAVNNAIGYGLGIMAGTFLSGYLFELVGTYYAFLFSGLIAVGAGSFMWFARHRLMEPPDHMKRNG